MSLRSTSIGVLALLWSAGVLLSIVIVYERLAVDALPLVGLDAGWDDDEVELARSGSFFLWMSIVATYSGFALAALPLLLARWALLIRETGATSRARLRAVAPAIVATLAMTVAVGYLVQRFTPETRPEPLPLYDPKVSVIWLLAVAPTVAAVWIAWLLARATEIDVEGAEPDATAAAADRFVARRREITWLLLAASGALVFLVLSVGAIERALRAQGITPGWDQDVQLGLAVLTSAVLLVAALPTLGAMNRAGGMLVTRLTEGGGAATRPWVERQAERDDARDRLGLATGPTDFLRQAAPFAAPVLAALIARLTES